MKPEAHRQFETLEGDHWWFRARRRVYLDLLRTALGSRPVERILDVGAGSGGFLPELSSLGGAVHYAEPRVHSVAACRERGFPYGVRARAEALPYAEMSFDLVCLFDVLEHAEDDAAVLGDETVLGIKNAILKSSQEKGILALGLITLVHIYAYSKGATFNPIVPILFLGPALAGVISLTSGKYGWWTLGAVGVSFAGILAVYTLGVALKEAKVEGDAKRKAAQEARVAASKQRKSGAGDSETPS